MFRNKKSKIYRNLKGISCLNTIMQTINMVAALVIAQLFSNITVKAVNHELYDTMKTALLIVALIFIMFLVGMAGNVFIQRRQAELRNRCEIFFVENLFKNSPDRIFCAEQGELLKNLSDDLAVVMKRYTDLYPCIISSGIGILGYTIFMLHKSLLIAVSLLLISLIQLIPPFIVKKYMQINYDECCKVEARVTDYTIEAVSGFEVIKLYGLKEWMQRRMAECHEEYLKVGRMADAVAAAQRSIYRLLDNILKFGTYAILGIYVLFGYSTLESAIVTIYLSGNFFAIVKQVFSVIPEIAVSHTAESRINKWNVSERVLDNPKTQNGEIVLKDVLYKYGEKVVFQGVNCRLLCDQNYLIVGKNGVGKTSLLNLIAGLILPVDGKITNIDWDSDNTSCNLVYVPQKDPDYDLKISALLESLKKEQQKYFFSMMEKFGLKEAGLREKSIRLLSGGERKKIFLALGFAMKPKWLLLDEPSNNLDVHGKQVLCEMLRERKGIIMISHDPVFSSGLDHILKVENGCVYEK